jgi:hypothetical protein
VCVQDRQLVRQGSCWAALADAEVRRRRGHRLARHQAVNGRLALAVTCHRLQHQLVRLPHFVGVLALHRLNLLFQPFDLMALFFVLLSSPSILA